MVLETRRLTLSEFQESDWQAVHEYASDPKGLLYVPGDPPTEEQTRENIRWMMRGKEDNPPRYEFAVVLKSEQRLIGWCAIRILYDELQQGELLYVFNPHYWGKGYATEAAAAALDYGFSQLSLRRIFATCRPTNIGSWRVMEKLGMQREGHLRQHRWIRGAWHDSFLYAILDYEWKARTRD